MFIVRFIFGFLATVMALWLAFLIGAKIFHSILAVEIFSVIFLVNGLLIFPKIARFPSVIVGVSLATLFGAGYLLLLSICGAGGYFT